jgi:hypothetical protein
MSSKADKIHKSLTITTLNWPGMNAEVLRCYKEHVEKHLAEKNKPSKWINAHVKMCEMLKLGKNKIDYENSWTRTKTVCVLGDGKYIGFMAHADTVTTMQCRFRPHYQIWDVANSEPTHNIFKDIYYAVPIGEKWVAATSNPYNGGSLPIYNFLTGNLVVDISEGAPFNYQILGFDKYVVTAGGSISCFDLETGASIFSIDNDAFTRNYHSRQDNSRVTRY